MRTLYFGKYKYIPQAVWVLTASNQTNGPHLVGTLGFLQRREDGGSKHE